MGEGLQRRARGLCRSWLAPPGRAVDIGDAGRGRPSSTTRTRSVKRERQPIDIEDVLLCAAAVLDDDERVAADVRRQYRWFVVDEFQDVSPLQFRLLELWLGDRDDVCVVGDPAQTIYTFAGASDRFLLEFPRKFPGPRRSHCCATTGRRPR